MIFLTSPFKWFMSPVRKIKGACSEWNTFSNFSDPEGKFGKKRFFLKNMSRRFFSKSVDIPVCKFL